MALRLLNVARTLPSLLVPKLKPVQPPNRTIFKRERLVPFVDDDPCVFSTKAIMHHWGVLPILAISLIGLVIKCGAIMLLALKKDDVWYTKDSAYYENFETRQGPWYKFRSRKWGGRDDYVMPPEAILARSGYVDGPPYEQKK